MTSRINVLKYPCKVLFLSDFNENQNVSANFRGEFSARNFIKILPVTVALFHADRLADMKRLAVAFGFGKASEVHSKRANIQTLCAPGCASVL